jgi:hypothetical protein
MNLMEELTVSHFYLQRFLIQFLVFIQKISHFENGLWVENFFYSLDHGGTPRYTITY